MPSTFLKMTGRASSTLFSSLMPIRAARAIYYEALRYIALFPRDEGHGQCNIAITPFIIGDTILAELPTRLPSILFSFSSNIEAVFALFQSIGSSIPSTPAAVFLLLFHRAP